MRVDWKIVLLSIEVSVGGQKPIINNKQLATVYEFVKDIIMLLYCVKTVLNFDGYEERVERNRSNYFKM